MPTLVHITNEKNGELTKRSGIALGKYRRVVYFMPVLQNHVISHQWLRELRQRGARVMVGVYFRLSSEEPVWVGRYNAEHRCLPLREAIREMREQADPLGYEMFVERKIKASEIAAVRHLPQDIGWRHMPHAHGRRPCPCPACLPRGAFNARRIREKYEPEPKPVSYEALKATIARSTDKDELLACLWHLSRKRRKADPAFLSPLLDRDDAELHEELARTLACFNHPASTAMLQALCRYPSADVKEAAAQSLLRRFRQDAVALLTAYSGDPVIDTVIADAHGNA